MSTYDNDNDPLRDDPAWTARRAEWSRRLGRLRPELEPLPDQLARLRRVTWALTLVPLLFAAIIVGILTAFGSLRVGLAVAAVVFGPVLIGAWLEDWSLHRRAAAYERDRAHHLARIQTPSFSLNEAHRDDPA